MPRKKKVATGEPAPFTGVTVQRSKVQNIHLDSENGTRLMSIEVAEDSSLTFSPKVSRFTLTEAQLRKVRALISQSINATIAAGNVGTEEVEEAAGNVGTEEVEEAAA